MLLKNTFMMSFVMIMIISHSLSAELAIDVTVPDSPDKDNKDSENVLMPVKPDVVTFKNKDRLHGKMISVNQDKGLLWKSEEALEDINFKIENINEIIFGVNSSFFEQSDSSIVLTNNDIIAGKLIKLDDKELVLKTEYAGELKINRNMVKAISPGSTISGITYQGPNKIEEWTLPNQRNNNTTVTVSDGELQINGNTSAGRDMKLPDQSRIEFELNSGLNVQCQVQFYGKKVDRYPRNGYVLQIANGYVYMQRYEDGSSNNLGNFRPKNLKSGKIKITILSDKKEKKLILLINDKISKEFSDSSWSGAGQFVTFISNSHNNLRIKKILVGKWNGRVPGSGKSESDKTNDTIKFNNDDVVTGKLKAIKDNKVTFATEYAEMNIPIERIKEIITAEDSRHRARRRGNDVKCYFKSGNVVTLAVSHIKDNIITGENGNFGEVNMKLRAFIRIQFNIYNEE